MKHARIFRSTLFGVFVLISSPSWADGQSPCGFAKLSQDIIRTAQESLAKFGFDPGPIDGVVGRKTRTALAEYHKARDEEWLGSEYIYDLLQEALGENNEILPPSTDDQCSW